MVGMLDSLSLKNTKLGLETLDLMGYDTRATSRSSSTAPTRSVGITPDDVSTIVGRPPDVFVPSDREIPRSVNEGTPIVASKPQSDAAKAFRGARRPLREGAGAEAGAAAELGRRRPAH